ncbi:MAG: GNAT family N-acetyltransferase [Carbonactinosporaceae bacterium]
MLDTASVRVLGGRDLDEALSVADRDPVSNVFVGSRLYASGLDPWRLGGEVWGYEVGGRLESLCYAGANLVPVQARRDAILAFSDRARRLGRRCSSIVGPAGPVGLLWELLKHDWGPAREVRAHQPVMEISRSSATVAPDPAVRPVAADEVDVLMPAAVAMFTEEVGVSPVTEDSGSLYRARVAELVALGRSFARIENGHVVFKAEIGAVTPQACQVQGVWVAPERRGEGLSHPGMAAVVEHALRDFAPLVTLYVNDFNRPARRTYRRVGFREVGSFMSVLF